MHSALQSLESLQQALREALSRQDWEAIGALDSQCRTSIGEVMDSAEPGLREQVEELSRLYAELQQAARAERERVAGELTRLNQSKQVDRAYKTFG
ncbi:flagellar protein FliT [Pseudomonas lopnurensis]|uniref:flagellar protein FliT n=1 Tax=Pseudomonas lopnurensis TaxID=1477517 RepID=UPI0028B1923F|nr:flagellar protein FliT [Pseudomonas lopnurensis]